MRMVEIVSGLIAALPLGAVTAASVTPIAALDLQKPFATRTPWRFTATQGPEIEDPVMGGPDTVPGAIALCLTRDGGRSCDPALVRKPGPDCGDIFREPHFLGRAAIVRPLPGRPLLLVQTASLHSANGDQCVGTRLLGYDRTSDRFTIAYDRTTGRNNNQEIRYVATGALAGAVVSAEPTMDAPFGYWITVERLAASGRYAQVLRYRGATRYGDGNGLAVIDAEMPGIQRRLGLWRTGQPLPLPARGCARPRLIHMALWCA